MKLIPFEEILDNILGPIGTPERDAHEARVEEAVNAYRLGEAIKKARLEQNLTQEQFGERLGVKKSQVSKIENGRNLSFSTIRRAFKALGVESASLNLGNKLGSIALW